VESAVSIISSFNPIDTSNYSIDPGNKVDFPNIMLVRFISKKSFESSTSTCSFDSYIFSSFSGSTGFD